MLEIVELKYPVKTIEESAFSKCKSLKPMTRIINNKAMNFVQSCIFHKYVEAV